ncbi:MAG: family NAD(P)-dependent oxidoreductase [Jatrophihabitans sp.]|nr:family NAD(P)-dependent oxidoreductase [Jatrophihabitans sp.]
MAAAPVDLHGRTVIVTGASPGSLGFETARTLTAWGADVVVTTRSRTEATVAALGGGATGHPLELADATSVRDFADWFASRHDRLDALVNNAGIHLDLRSSWKQPTLVDGHEIHWRTNYLGTMQLTHALLPVLAATGNARVVNVVSKLHERGRNEFLFAPITPYDSWVAYGTSKLALIHAATEVERRVEGVRGYSLHPGSVFTHIADRGLDGHRVLGAARRVLAPLERRMLRTPAEGAQTSLHCATAQQAEGGYYRDCRPAQPSDDAQDPEVAARLWDVTAEWVGGR